MINASWTLADVFGPGNVYIPAPCYETSEWLPRERSALDFLTGAQLALASEFPVVCHRTASTPAVLALLEDAGLPRPRHLLRYTDANSYRKLLGDLGRQDVRIVLQHSHPQGAIPEEHLWIPRSLLCFVNNKRNLLDFVSAAQAPERLVVSGERLDTLPASQLRLPVVLKAAEDVSTGGGCGVRVCRTQADVEQARQTFGHCEAVVVEEFLDFELSWCVQFFVPTDGRIRYVGAAEQVCEPSGGYRGNWLAAETSAPLEVEDLGREIAVRVAERGYRGFLGIDIGLCRDGRALAFDLNGRFTGSAVALSVFPSLAASGRLFARYGSWKGSGDFANLERTVRSAMNRGHFVPLAAYDPRGGDPLAVPRVNGLLLGHTRDEVLQHEKDFDAAGLR